jgi:hypothetical protein
MLKVKYYQPNIHGELELERNFWDHEEGDMLTAYEQFQTWSKNMVDFELYDMIEIN